MSTNPATCPECGQTMPRQVRFRRATVRRLQYIRAHSSNTSSGVPPGNVDDDALVLWGLATVGGTVAGRAMFATHRGRLFLSGTGRVSRRAFVINGTATPIGRSRLVSVYELMGAAYNEPMRPVGEPVGLRADAPAST